VSDNGHFAFSAGGSGARINAVDEDGGLGDTGHEIFFVPEQEVPNVDKTRKAVVSTRPGTFIDGPTLMPYVT
jgi:carboxy-cis,cis-muconate cyclase